MADSRRGCEHDRCTSCGVCLHTGFPQREHVPFRKCVSDLSSCGHDFEDFAKILLGRVVSILRYTVCMSTSCAAFGSALAIERRVAGASSEARPLDTPESLPHPHA
jgi:hypothetical protein